LYEIKDSELDLLEKGTAADMQLSFSIFLLSLAFSSICALATARFPNSIVQNVFTFAAVVGILMGPYLLISWYRTRTSLTELCRRIRDRIPPDMAPQAPGEVPGEEPDEAPRPLP
jgi:hypothetical protein